MSLTTTTTTTGEPEMIHSMPPVALTFNSAKASAKKPAACNTQLIQLIDYMNCLHAYIGGPDDSTARIGLMKAIEALQNAICKA